jgi:hypothetical protein
MWEPIARPESERNSLGRRGSGTRLTRYRHLARCHRTAAASDSTSKQIELSIFRVRLRRSGLSIAVANCRLIIVHPVRGRRSHKQFRCLWSDANFVTVARLHIRSLEAAASARLRLSPGLEPVCMSFDQLVYDDTKSGARIRRTVLGLDVLPISKISHGQDQYARSHRP